MAEDSQPVVSPRRVAVIDVGSNDGTFLRCFRDAGLKVLGNTPFKYLAVHIVDKGAKLYDAPPK